MRTSTHDPPPSRCRRRAHGVFKRVALLASSQRTSLGLPMIRPRRRVDSARDVSSRASTSSRAAHGLDVPTLRGALRRAVDVVARRPRSRRPPARSTGPTRCLDIIERLDGVAQGARRRGRAEHRRGRRPCSIGSSARVGADVRPPGTAARVLGERTPCRRGAALKDSIVCSSRDRAQLDACTIPVIVRDFSAATARSSSACAARGALTPRARSRARPRSAPRAASSRSDSASMRMNRQTSAIPIDDRLLERHHQRRRRAGRRAASGPSTCRLVLVARVERVGGEREHDPEQADDHLRR